MFLFLIYLLSVGREISAYTHFCEWMWVYTEVRGQCLCLPLSLFILVFEIASLSHWNLELTASKPSWPATPREPPPAPISMSPALGLQAVPPCPDLYMADKGRFQTQVLTLAQDKHFTYWAISTSLLVFPFKEWLSLIEEVPALSVIFLRHSDLETQVKLLPPARSLKTCYSCSPRTS